MTKFYFEVPVSQLTGSQFFEVEAETEMEALNSVKNGSVIRMVESRVSAVKSSFAEATAVSVDSGWRFL